MTSSDWKTFDLAKALAGKRVGFMQTDPNDTSMTGLLGKKYVSTEGGVSVEKYRIEIGIYTMYVGPTGTVLSCTPEYTGIVGQTMLMVETTIDYIVGTEQARTRSQETGYDNVVDLTTMEPQDYFALEVLGMILRNVKNPEMVDDANMLYYCDAAYRWANVMKLSAANARKGTAQSSGTGTVTVNQGDLQSNTEKLLYNMVAKFTDIKNQLNDNKTSLSTGLSQLKSQIADDNHEIIEGVDAIAENTGVVSRNMDVPEQENPIAIQASIYQQKYIRLEVQQLMCYSDLSVYMELDVMEGTTAKTMEVSFIMPKGSVIVVESLDSLVDSVTAITSMSVRGQGLGDPNEYTLIQPQPNV